MHPLCLTYSSEIQFNFSMKSLFESVRIIMTQNITILYTNVQREKRIHNFEPWVKIKNITCLFFKFNIWTYFSQDSFLPYFFFKIRFKTDILGISVRFTFLYFLFMFHFWIFLFHVSHAIFFLRCTLAYTNILSQYYSDSVWLIVFGIEYKSHSCKFCYCRRDIFEEINEQKSFHWQKIRTSDSW